MTEIIDLNSKRSPVTYTVTIVHHYDDTLEFRVEDVADDPRSREAVMSAFRRISGADEEIEKLRTDVRNAVFADSEYAAEMDEQNAALRAELAAVTERMSKLDFERTAAELERDALREENAKLRKALKPFADVAEKDIGEDEYDSDLFRPMIRHNLAPRLTCGDLRAARAAILEGGKND